MRIFFRNRLERESIIVKAMIRMYCRHFHHSRTGLCKVCSEIDSYSERRLLHCKFGKTKPVCKDCPVHCYAPKQREEMRQIMRWAGPRMLFSHPLYALIHLADSKKHSTITNNKNEPNSKEIQ
ncbi:MAG: nitrous oxide-stimulated promoter family protein [Bacteroidales bacterium]|nr:nitrous oxide-stimulated promoter family protein [Bacteroidales bacterium]